nr:EOG090X0439 [Eurycercus lamellatus]
MAAELPDALEKLALKAEQAEIASGSSLSKYFGNADNDDDIFDSISKPTSSETAEPKVNFFKSPAAAPVKEDIRSPSKAPPTFAFKKGDEDEPKIFSYFSQPEANVEGKDQEATEFFDHISQLASKTHEPLEISSHVEKFTSVVDSSIQQVSENSLLEVKEKSNVIIQKPLLAFSSLQHDLPLQREPTGLSNLPTHVIETLPVEPSIISEPVWNKAQELASSWWIPSEKLWFSRLSMLMKSSLIEMAYNEVTAFGDLDSPDLYYDYYPELSKHGTMVPFSFRLLAAEIPAHHNQVNRAQTKLCRLLATVRQILLNLDRFANADGMTAEEKLKAFELWSRRETKVVLSLVNCALMKKLQRPGVDPCPALYSTLGRVYLQLGDVQQGQKCFNSAADLRNSASPIDTVASLLDAGLVAIAQNAFTEAHGYFKQALALEPDNPVLVNNAAVCLLYTGCMRESMLMLEENLGTKPDAMIRDDTVLNVCTLYELESSLTTQRKLGMLRLASQWRNDNLKVSSFKLQLSS